MSVKEKHREVQKGTKKKKRVILLVGRHFPPILLHCAQFSAQFTRETRKSLENLFDLIFHKRLGRAKTCSECVCFCSEWVVDKTEEAVSLSLVFFRRFLRDEKREIFHGNLGTRKEKRGIVDEYVRKQKSKRMKFWIIRMKTVYESQ